MTAAMVAAATAGVIVQGSPDEAFSGISTDSRTIAPGELFFALRGERFDGHRFISEAAARGAKGGVVQQEPPQGMGARFVLIKVKETLQALGDFAQHWRKEHPIPLIAVVGSNGKTTTKEMVAAIISRRYKVIKNEGNINNLIGLPLTVTKIDPSHQVAILEMGMNRPGEILRLTEIAQPTIGIMTNIAPAHLEGVGSIQGVMEAKGELLQGMPTDGSLVFNADDPRVAELSRRFVGKKTSFAIQRDADWWARDIHQAENGLSFQIENAVSAQHVTIRAIGRHQVYNALAAAAAASLLGLSMEDIRDGLEAFTPQPMRMELIPLGDGVTIINDAYNANPRSMEAALQALAELGVGKKIAVLGDMCELGRYAGQAHLGLGRKAAEMGIDRLFLLGGFAEKVAQGARERGMSPEAIHIGKDHGELTALLATALKGVDKGWILVKGSRIMKMEEVIRQLRDII